jgi:TPR repeat protein
MRLAYQGTVIAAVLLSILLAGCRPAPAPAAIEAVAMDAAQRGDAAAERRLVAWADAGLPVAERELGLLYRARRHPGRAQVLFARAAHQGDAEAAFQLGILAHERGTAADTAAAARWYGAAAQHGHAGAALRLALMLKNGDGIRQDKAAAAHWLAVAATAGNAHAMFLLSNAYAAGDGVAPDPARARALLEGAADHDYPAALQQLALVKQTGDALTARDDDAARALLQEAFEHHRSNATRF